MITLTLTEAQAARICYAMEREADEANRLAHAERKDGALSVQSGRTQALYEAARDEALAIVRAVTQLVEA